MMQPNGRPALVVDPHEVARWGLVQILQTKRYAQTSHEASSIEVAMRLAVEHQPGFVITEMKLVDGSGLKLVRWLKKQSFESRILVYTGRTESADAERAMLEPFRKSPRLCEFRAKRSRPIARTFEKNWACAACPN